MTYNGDDHLRAWARGDYTIEAAVELLIRTGWTGRLSFIDDCIRDPGSDRPWVDFDELGAILRGERASAIMAASGGELRVLRIAYSLAGNGLAHNIPGLDRAVLDLVLAAIAHANGSHDHSLPIFNEDRTAIRGYDRPGSLHPWPEDGVD